MKTEFLQKNKESLHGSAIPYIVYTDIARFEISYNADLQITCTIINSIMNTIIKNDCEIQKLYDLQKALLCNLLN